MGADPNPALFSVFHLFSLLFSVETVVRFTMQ